jgi:23S rRNA (uracil1939-C5)-methyltransferase
VKKKKQVITELLLTDYAAEGKALGRHEGKVVFVEGGVPGDTANVTLSKNKKDWAEGRITQLVKPSTLRIPAFCKHFGVCGGCKWQMLPYEKQLEFKHKEAVENLRRIGKVTLPEIPFILGGDRIIHYRNKLEFTFSTKRYLTREEVERLPAGQDIDTAATAGTDPGAFGYHAPRLFDKIIDIDECWLMDDVNNGIRNSIREIATAKNYPYYNIKDHTGWLRNVIIRYSRLGELMVNVIVGYKEDTAINDLLSEIRTRFPAITTLLYTINTKWNDSIYDLEPVVYDGPGFILEKLGGMLFKISPKSFFQTNSYQAEKLYATALDFAGLEGHETVYDLYCGTGSIGLYVSGNCKKVIGVETVKDAVLDARENAAINKVSHTEFYDGDVIDVCTDAFFQKHGHPDVIITDPPRAGMHEKLVRKLLDIAAPKIVYVSCNVATQARDINLLSEKYSVERVQPVDMFPHTHHIECVVLLTLKPLQSPSSPELS